MKDTAILESVLFAAGEPVKLSDLAGLLEVSKAHLIKRLEQLRSEYAGRGITLVWDDRTAQMVTAPEMAAPLARFMQTELRGKLSASSLEALAVIAYNGPTTRPHIERIRGVQSAQAMRTLAMRGLITEIGRSPDPGRPIIYDITVELYKHLGISGRAQLPEVPAELLAKLTELETEESESSA